MFKQRFTIEKNENRYGASFELPLTGEKLIIKDTMEGDGAVFQKIYHGAFVQAVDADRANSTITVTFNYDWCEELLKGVK